MQGNRWLRLERLFNEALAVPVAARAGYLSRACGDDAELRRELDELLRAHDAPGVLDALPQAPAQASAQPQNMPSPLPSLIAGSQLGLWQVGELIGRGGMGEVYRASRVDDAFEQHAALKLLRHDAVAQIERFHAERRILARLEHPGIARLLDGGIAPDGRPYTVMEYVDGASLIDCCVARKATLAERLALFAQVCDAVGFAHRNLVIHRDLKPENILVDADGRVKLLDFGIAKLLDSAAVTGATNPTVAPFTPDYAAPEQLSGEPVTTATDIYALGVVLFELLTGERPLRTRGLPSSQLLKQLLDRTAPLASRVAYANPDSPIAARALAGDLDAIIARCLRKEAAHRYETVDALKQDLQRQQRREPVLARSGARAYVARRFLRRHWLPVTGVLVLIVALAGAALYANVARLRTEQALHRADVVRDFVVDLFRQNRPDAGNSRSMTARELVDVGARRVEGGFDGDADTRIELLGVSGNLYRALGEYPRAGELLKQRLEQAVALYASDDARRIEAQLDMAQTETSAEHFDAADALLQSALAGAGTDRDALLPLRARVLLALARNEGERGHYDAATALAQQAIDLRDRLPATTPAERAEALARRGLYLFQAGHIAEAEAPLLDALGLLDPSRRDNLNELLDVREDLGKVLTSLGRFDEALPLLQANTVAIRRALGDRHPALATALHQLASVLRQSGDPAAAIPVFRESLVVYEQAYGPDHSNCAAAWTGLGQALSADGQSADAIDALSHAQIIYAKTLGPTHVFTAVSTTALADARLTAGQVDAAEAGFRDALAAYAKIGDGRHIYAEAARLGLGRCLNAEQRFGDAVAPLREARSRFIAAFGGDDRRAIDAALALSQALAGNGQRDEAQGILDASEQALAASSRDVSRLREKLSAARAQLK